MTFSACAIFGPLATCNGVWPTSSTSSTASRESYRNLVPSFVVCVSKRFASSDACRLAQGTDALIRWRTLFERSELVRPPQASVPPGQSCQTGRHWFWVLLPEQKGLACRGETRQHRTSRWHKVGHTRARHSHLPIGRPKPFNWPIGADIMPLGKKLMAYTEDTLVQQTTANYFEQ